MVTMTLEIPVEKYLFKYLSREYGNPFIFDHADPRSAVICSKIDLSGKTENKRIRPRSFHNHLDYKIKIQAPYYKIPSEAKSVNISEENIRNLIAYFKQEFFRSMCLYVQATLQVRPLSKNVKNISAKRSVYNFLAIYNIQEEDYALESAVRNYSNYRRAGKMLNLEDNEYISHAV